MPDGAADTHPALAVHNLTVHYGRVPILHDLTLTLERGVVAVVGRNGMGKSTLCKTIVGLVPATSGGIWAGRTELSGLPPHRIAQAGVGYVPQGRRVWASLSVDEHLRLAFRGPRSAYWTPERIYDTFPRLYERRSAGGSELSGGEQQMLAIGRALAGNPRLLVMDEPTEGLAPVIVAQVTAMIKALATDGGMSVLLVEQNLGVAVEVSERIAIMMHGRLARELKARELAADQDLQRRLLGVGRQGEEEDESLLPEDRAAEVQVIRIARQHGEEAGTPSYTFGDGARPVYSAAAVPTRWSSDGGGPPEAALAPDADPVLADPADEHRTGPELPPVSIAAMTGRHAYVLGTFDTKREELMFLAHRLRHLGIKTVTVDLATGGRPSPADVSPREVARHHPKGAGAVFTGDRGTSIAAMADACERFIRTRRDVGGIISAGGSGATALAAPAMRALPIGIPKFMVSTVAGGDVGRYVGGSDIAMMYSVTDVQGLNSVSEQVLSNAAHALAGMIAHRRSGNPATGRKPAIGLTMFGVTTPCVQSVQRALQSDYDCLVFHATGTGGRSMEKLIDSHLLAGVIDVTTTEIADHLVGGVFSAGPDRLGAVVRSKIPYVGSCGALDMVNFHAKDTVPARFGARNLYVHNPNVTLMRTTAAENEAIGRFLAERLNAMDGPVRFLLPLGGVSSIDAPGKPFHDPEADRVLFSTIEKLFVPRSDRRLIKLPHNINDPAFAKALVDNFVAIVRPQGAVARAAS